MLECGCMISLLVHESGCVCLQVPPHVSLCAFVDSFVRVGTFGTTIRMVSIVFIRRQKIVPFTILLTSTGTKVFTWVHQLSLQVLCIVKVSVSFI